MAQLYTEHTLKLPDGIEILYTDSGAPNTEDYTTIVALHGCGFNGYCFERLHEYAPKYNVRMIFWNRRDYRGSTKYTDEELEDLRAGRKRFQDRLALQISWFLEHFIRNEHTPKISPGRAAGGFVLMGWSFGNATLLALFGDPEVVPNSLYEMLEPHVRSLVLYDPPFVALGYPAPVLEGIYDPCNDPECTTVDQVYDNFQQWVSSYFQHSNITTGCPSGMSFEKLTERRTIAQWTEVQKARYCDKSEALRSELPAFAPPMQRTLRMQSQKALFDEGLARSYFPNINVLHISGDATCYYCMWAYMESSRLYSEAIGRGEIVRPITFKLLEGNHFLHYDVPELFIRELLDGCVLK
ncbi:Alpha/Beta hydrolase protein [Mycena crocata]|nr:Alpha/Beta hydrolase protein [Mycena crocata]